MKIIELGKYKIISTKSGPKIARIINKRLKEEGIELQIS